MRGVCAIISFFGAYVATTISKFAIYLVQSRFRRPGEAFSRALESGGMPSAHTSEMAAMTTYIGLAWGIDSAAFALAVGVTIIVAYDAMHVRYAVGRIGKEVNKLSGKKARVYEGHTLPQVLVGGIIGVLVGVAVYFVAKL